MKDIHINPKDDSTTIIKRSSNCCGGGHQTIAGALLKSPEWKAWYMYASKNHLFDVDETQELDMMGDEHFKAFIKYIVYKIYKKCHLEIHKTGNTVRGKLTYTKAQLKYFKEMGKLGGQKLLKERGTEYFSKISKLKKQNA